MIYDTYNHSNGSFIGKTTNHDISFPISFNSMVFSILRNLSYVRHITDNLTMVYRDTKGNNGWNNSKMTVTPDYNDIYWQSVLMFFVMIGI